MTSHPELSRENLLEILAAVPEILTLIDEDLKVRFVNTPEMGYTDEGVRGTPALDFVPEEHRDTHRERLLRVLETAEEVTFELPVLDAEAETRWVEGSLIPIERGGKVVGILSATRDVTARHLAQEEAETLRSLIPICSWCGKIRSDDGYWSKVESYIEEHSDSRVTHGMCPACEGTVEKNGTDGPA